MSNTIPFHDISYAQGNYNMAVNTDPMVMMKASGFYTSSKLPYLDTQLVDNYANAKKYKKIPFMYHFAGGADPLTEAKYFIQAVSPLTEGDGYALDFEIDLANPVQWTLVFVTHVHDVTGCWPWPYIDRSRRVAFDWSPVFKLCSEWIAAPDVSFNSTIPGVGVYIAQQGPIVNGVDTDEFFGTLDALKKYTYHKPVAIPPVPAPPVLQPTPAPVVVTPPVITAPIPPVEPPVTPEPTPPTPVIPLPVSPLPPVVPTRKHWYDWVIALLKQLQII